MHPMPLGRHLSRSRSTCSCPIRAASPRGGRLRLLGQVGWRYAYGDVAPRALLALSGGAPAFTTAGTPIGRNALVAEAGLD
ncbi:autotransporter domain-containing protein [Microvirga sp. TS319]|uniref:autotransporter domain-containing protein n=1 Tax=Microvirga sp. TS319 TaxID=3241165 RepID=UPI003519E819